jgi:hypothetical protein
MSLENTSRVHCSSSCQAHQTCATLQQDTFNIYLTIAELCLTCSCIMLHKPATHSTLLTSS